MRGCPAKQKGLYLLEEGSHRRGQRSLPRLARAPGPPKLRRWGCPPEAGPPKMTIVVRWACEGVGGLSDVLVANHIRL